MDFAEGWFDPKQADLSEFRAVVVALFECKPSGFSGSEVGITAFCLLDWKHTSLKLAPRETIASGSSLKLVLKFQGASSQEGCEMLRVFLGRALR